MTEFRKLVRMGQLLKFCQLNGFTVAHTESLLDIFDPPKVSRARVTSTERERAPDRVNTLKSGAHLKPRKKEDVC